jgi:hypothetical protein
MYKIIYTTVFIVFQSCSNGNRIKPCSCKENEITISISKTANIKKVLSLKLEPLMDYPLEFTEAEKTFFFDSDGCMFLNRKDLKDKFLFGEDRLFEFKYEIDKKMKRGTFSTKQSEVKVDSIQ